MVMLLFLQVTVMVIERYINRTNTKVVVKKIGAPKEAGAAGDLDDKLIATMRPTQSDNRSMSMHVEKY